MSVQEMKQFIVENLEHIEDLSKLEKIVHIIEEDVQPKTDMKAFFESAVNRYGDVMQKLAE